jgi:mono/diheme cytochrome c family protein
MVFKWVAILLGSLLGLILAILTALFLVGTARLNRKYDISVENIPIPSDAESIAAGERWVQSICIGCHKADLSGGPFFEAPFGYTDAANLTPGKGGLGATFSDQDWIRSIRYGVRPDGKSALIMPSHYFWNFNDEDLGEIIAYLKSLPPVDQEIRKPHSNFLGRALLAAGMFGKAALPAELIFHDTRPTDIIEPGETPAYGEYLALVSGCQDCHGQDLSGGKNADPAAKLAPNLTPGGELAAWSETDFIKSIKEGITPSGRQLDPVQMPWEHYRNFSEEELRAIWLYVQSLPKLPTTIP